MSSAGSPEDNSYSEYASRLALSHAVSKPAKKLKKDTEEGARVDPTYHHRREEYVLVTRNDLDDVKVFGVLQQVLFGVGSFFFSGAFWLVCGIFAEQPKFQFTSWMLSCAISMIFGGILFLLSIVIFFMKQRRLDNRFPANLANDR